MADDKTIKQQREEFAKEIRDVNKELKPGFQKIIKNLEEASPQIAKITADFRASSKDTFKGALATKKLKGLTGLVDKYMKEGQDALDPKELKALQSNFSQEIDGVMQTFDFDGMRNAQIEFNETQDKISELEDARQARIDKSMQKNHLLGQLDKELAELEVKSKTLQGGALNFTMSEIKRVEELREQKEKEITAAIQREIDKEKETLEVRSAALESTTEEYKKGLEKATDYKGMTKFSEGLDELIGIDLLGMADTFTKKINAFGDVMKGIGDALKNPVKKFKEKFGPALEGVTSVFSRGEKSQSDSGDKKGMLGSILGSKKGEKEGAIAKALPSTADKSIIPSKGSKSGGFLKSIAEGVKKFGDSKVLKGAISMALLGGSVGLLAIGLKQFNGVDFKQMGKGLIAMTGLVLLAKMLRRSTGAMLKGSLAVLALGAAMVPLAFSLNLMKDVGLGTIGVIAAALITLGVAAALLGSFVPLIALGALAIGLLGASLIPFAYAADLAAKAFGNFVPDIMMLSQVDGLNLIAVGAGLAAIGAGLVAMTGGSLIGSLLEGLGSLFGAKSPMEKVTEFAKGLENVNMKPLLDLGEAFKNLGSVGNVITMFKNLKPSTNNLNNFSEAIDTLTEAMIRLDKGVPKELSWYEKMKSLAGKVMGTTEQERIEGQMEQSEEKLIRKETQRDRDRMAINEPQEKLVRRKTKRDRDYIQPASDSAMSMEMAEVRNAFIVEKERYNKLQQRMMEHNAKYPGLYTETQITAAGNPNTGNNIKGQRMETYSASGTTTTNSNVMSNVTNNNSGQTYTNVNAPKTMNDEPTQGKLSPVPTW